MLAERRYASGIACLGDFRALFVKTFLLARRKPGQTLVEIALAYTFMGFLLGMRSILDRRYIAAYQTPRSRPQDLLFPTGMGTLIYYYPGESTSSSFLSAAHPSLLGNPCATSIVKSTVASLIARWPTFPKNGQFLHRSSHNEPPRSLFAVRLMSDPTLSNISNTTLLSVAALIHFTNLDACNSPASMPDDVRYTLRMPEYGHLPATLTF